MSTSHCCAASTSGSSHRLELTRQIEQALSNTFAYQSRVVVRSFEQMKRVVEGAPKGFGARGDISTRRDLSQGSAGDGVLDFFRLISRAAQSHLSRIVSKPEYQNMTIRNWNTTGKLLELMERIRPQA